MLVVEESHRRLAEVLVKLADADAVESDLPAYLVLLSRHSVELLGAAGAGVLLADSPASPGLAGGCSVATMRLELWQLREGEGPGVDSLTTGASIHCRDLNEARARWPRFAPAAQAEGFRSVHTLSLRRGDHIIGALDLFTATTTGLSADILRLGQSIADVAAIGLLHHFRTRRDGVLVNQLQGALDSRVRIEQAKGILAERRGISVDEAFSALRRHACSHNRRLLDVAQAVIDSASDGSAPLIEHRQLNAHSSQQPPPGSGPIPRDRA